MLGLTRPTSRKRFGWRERAIARRVVDRLRARIRRESTLALRDRFVSLEHRLDAMEARLGEVNGAEARSAVEALIARVDQVAAVMEEREARLRSWQAQTSAALRFVADEEAENRRRLWELRDEPSYDAAFDGDDPLVSIPIPTYQGFAELRERALPSALGQTYSNIEIVIVGDGAPAETSEVVHAFDDPRVRYVNLAHRGPYPSEPESLWGVAGPMPFNEAIRLSKGQWIAPLNDDDEFSPDHVERLVTAARAARAEVAYGKLLRREPDGTTETIGRFPPEHAHFGWQMAIFHSGLRFFGFQLAAAAFDEPGDWHLCRRMLGAGVRFTMIPEVVCDYYPSRSWKPER